MRNHVISAIASLGLATLLVGSASAADWNASRQAQTANGNLAEQDTLQRDATGNWLHRAGPGVVISQGDNRTVASNRLKQNASAEDSQSWLHRSSAGAVLGQANTTAGTQAAELNSYRED